jgi:capsid assembly protease
MNGNLAISRFAASGIALVASRFEGLVAASLAEITNDMIVASAEEDFFDPMNKMIAYRPYEVKDGVLIIPVKGLLLADFPYALGSWATGYEYIKQVLRRGLDDNTVKSIAYLVDSPGGQVEDCFPLVDEIRTASKIKPSKAFVKSGYSAAYAIASATNGIIVAPVTGGVGSVGVVTTHVDYSKYLENAGVKVTYIKFGAHKTDGNPNEPLGDSARERIQATIDRMGEIFVASVAANRGMDEAAVRATEALTYVAEEAVAIGFADSVGSLEDALVEFKAETSDTINKRTEDMTTAVNKPAAESVDTALANEKSISDAKAAGMEEGAKAAREQASAILALPEAKGRESLATKLAFKPGMSVDDAKDLLASAPLPAPVAEASKGNGNQHNFEAAMGKENPELGEEGEAELEKDTSAKAVSDRIGANFKKAKGIA